MSLSHCCRLFGISRQAIYQSENRAKSRIKELSQVKELVQTIRMEMPRIATRKLYYLLKEDLLIKESINTYNNKRPHLSLNMKTPNFIHEKTEEDILFGLN